MYKSMLKTIITNNKKAHQYLVERDVFREVLEKYEDDISLSVSHRTMQHRLFLMCIYLAKKLSLHTLVEGKTEFINRTFGVCPPRYYKYFKRETSDQLFKCCGVTAPLDVIFFYCTLTHGETFPTNCIVCKRRMWNSDHSSCLGHPDDEDKEFVSKFRIFTKVLLESALFNSLETSSDIKWDLWLELQKEASRDQIFVPEKRNEMLKLLRIRGNYIDIEDKYHQSDSSNSSNDEPSFLQNQDPTLKESNNSSIEPHTQVRNGVLQCNTSLPMVMIPDQIDNKDDVLTSDEEISNVNLINSEVTLGSLHDTTTVINSATGISTTSTLGSSITSSPVSLISATTNPTYITSATATTATATTATATTATATTAITTQETIDSMVNIKVEEALQVALENFDENQYLRDLARTTLLTLDLDKLRQDLVERSCAAPQSETAEILKCVLQYDNARFSIQGLQTSVPEMYQRLWMEMCEARARILSLLHTYLTTNVI